MSEQNRHLANIATHTKNMWAKLCELAPAPFTVTGVDCEGVPVTTEATSIVQTVPHPDFVQKVQICTPSIDPEIVCLSNDGGVTIIKGVVEFDTSTIPTTKTIYLFDGSLATGYEVIPCNNKTFDTEFREVCVDGQKWLQVLVFDKSVSMVAPVQVGWIDSMSTVVSAPDPSLINNINCNECISTPQGTLITWG